MKKSKGLDFFLGGGGTNKVNMDGLNIAAIYK
jgi:hypothetical protein